MDSVKLSSSRYKEELREKEEKAKLKHKEKEKERRNDIQDIEREIKKIENGIEVADKAISDGSSKLEAHLSSKRLDPVKLQADIALIQMGIQRKKKLLEDLSNLLKKKESYAYVIEVNVDFFFQKKSAII